MLGYSKAHALNIFVSPLGRRVLHFLKHAIGPKVLARTRPTGCVDQRIGD